MGLQIFSSDLPSGKKKGVTTVLFLYLFPCLTKGFNSRSALFCYRLVQCVCAIFGDLNKPLLLFVTRKLVSLSRKCQKGNKTPLQEQIDPFKKVSEPLGETEWDVIWRAPEF